MTTAMSSSGTILTLLLVFEEYGIERIRITVIITEIIDKTKTEDIAMLFLFCISSW